jgi:hypothetical protein
MSCSTQPNIQTAKQIATSLIVGRHVEDARMQRDAAKPSLFCCVASYVPPSLGSTSLSISPWFNIGLAC